MITTSKQTTRRNTEMKATFNSNKEESAISFEFKVTESIKAEKIVKLLEEYGYYQSHRETSEYINNEPFKIFVLMTGDIDMTISQMKEDYSEAKKAAQ